FRELGDYLARRIAAREQTPPLGENFDHPVEILAEGFTVLRENLFPELRITRGDPGRITETISDDGTVEERRISLRIKRLDQADGREVGEVTDCREKAVVSFRIQDGHP